MEINKKFVMYSVSLRHLSGIQKGIQSWHADTSYSKIFDGPVPASIQDENYKNWKRSPTVVVLETDSCQALRDLIMELRKNLTLYEAFFEEDLDNIITSVCFLGNEYVWDKETYPDNDDFQISTIDATPKQKYELKHAAQLAANILLYGKHDATLRQIKNKYRLASN